MSRALSRLRHASILATFPLLVALGAGCATTQASYVHSDAALGRVVIYRNGVAYFERVAVVDDDVLRLRVPADKVDDFLKSLTITDATTGRPAGVSYPTDNPRALDGLIEMAIRLEGPRPHRLRLTYVTEAPAWKPSYRLSVAEGGKVHLEASAIVDNTSGEDWRSVKLGVGSSSAMSFRFDLRSIRLVERETLRANDLFAQAPPSGGATHLGEEGREKTVLAELDDQEVDGKKGEAPRREALASAARSAPKKRASKHAGDAAAAAPTATSAPPDAAPGEPFRAGVGAPSRLDGLAARLRATDARIVVEGFAERTDVDKAAASLDRANRARDALLRAGVAPERVTAVGRGEQLGKRGGVRFVEAPRGEQPVETPGIARPGDGPSAGDPIGTSHFESETAMTVRRGSSAMVPILHTDTDGEVVYLYDAESPRGNQTFPFRSVRFKNPSGSQLETGPVSVFGDGRFVGEGMIEPVPGGAVAFVPFALDRQVLVERDTGESDRVSKIVTVQRGVFHTELQHKKKTSLVLVNRDASPRTVYVRHTVPRGYTLVAPRPAADKLGDAVLFKVELAGGARVPLTIEEETPVLRTTDLRTPEGMALIRAFVSDDAKAGPLAAEIGEIVKLHTEVAKVGEAIVTAREQMGELRQRMDELHAQVVTLRAVRSPNQGLLAGLEKKLAEVSDRLSKATLALVGLQERQMIARVKLEDALAELSLTRDAK